MPTMRATRIITVGIFFVAAGLTIFGQESQKEPEFEVVSIKLWDGSPHGAQTGNSDGGPGTRYPEIYGTNSTIRWLVARAWGLTDSDKQVSGPSWIDGKQFAVDAKVPPGTTKEQFQKMLQKMLAQRFGLVVHHEITTLPVFDLTIAKNGPKLQLAGSAPAAEVVSDGSDKNGFPVLTKPGIVSRYGPGAVAHLTAREQTLESLDRMLSLPNAAGRNIINKTGLTDKYDFTLQYDMETPGGATADLGLSLFDAIQQQLGLKLVDSKATFDLVVIDHVERLPTPN
jgi:uncharacterized protein (TIGR03435 family)